MGLKLLTAPTADPVTLDQAKAQARIDYSQAGQDALLQNVIIPGCTRRVEAYLGRRLMASQWLLTLDEFPSGEVDRIVLPYAAPLFVEGGGAPKDVEVKYYDAAGVLTVLAAAEYVKRDAEQPVELIPAYGKSWPAARAQRDAVEVRYWAGYGLTDPTLVPAAMREAIAIFCATQLANREAAVTGTIAAEVPLSAQWLLDPFRIVRFAA